MVLVDRWVKNSLVPRSLEPQDGCSPASSPSKRVSRRNGLSHETDYRAFERVDVQHYNDTADDDQYEQEPDVVTLNKFQIGDTVIIDKTYIANQKWLHAPEYLCTKKSSRSKRRGKAVEINNDDCSWTHEDGLGMDDLKVGVITRLFQDVKDEMMAQVRWFARPGAIWGHEGPPEGEELRQYELYYTSDSTFLHEARERANWRPGQPPPPPLGQKTPLCTDTVKASSITRHVRIVSAQDDDWPRQHQDNARLAVGQTPFLVRRVYDAKPVRHAEFLGDIDWYEVYERGVRRGDWDVEPTWSDQVPIEVKRKSVKTPTKLDSKNRKSVYVVDKSDADSSSSDDESDEDDFRRRSRFMPPASESESETDESEGDRTSDDDKETDVDDDELVTDDEDGERRTAYPTPLKSGSKRRRPRTFGDGERRKKSKKSRNHQSPETVVEFIRPRISAASKKRAAEASARRKRFHQKRLASKGAVNAVPPAFMSDEAFQQLAPFKRAQALLHVSATPEFLPCREEQREQISLLLSDAILSQYGTCLYIHGVPGTGKTATVYSVVRELQNDQDIGDFQFVEINGMKISEPQTAYSILWEAISGARGGAARVTPRQALTQLENHFQTPSPSRKTTVVLVDELDQMITKKQDVVYNFFNWPHIPHSRLIVLAVANTMDLPERSLNGKIRSRLGTDRIVFQPYSWQQLQEIVCTRLGPELREQTFELKAIDLIAKRVAGSAGDARKALDVARRTLEKVDQLDLATDRPKRVCTVMDASQTYKEMSDFGANSFLKSTSLIQRILMLSVAQVSKRAGVSEVLVDDVLSHAHRFMTNASLASLSGFQPSQTTLMTLLRTMHSQRLIAVDSGASSSTSSGERDSFSWCKLGVNVGEVWDVLRDDQELSDHVPRV
ncbi:hypothetical protein ACM66B_005607 [Microbotryomycetes sp. NB124-2]